MMTSGMTAGLHAGRDLEDHSKRVLAEKVLPVADHREALCRLDTIASCMR